MVYQLPVLALVPYGLPRYWFNFADLKSTSRPMLCVGLDDRRRHRIMLTEFSACSIIYYKTAILQTIWLWCRAYTNVG